MPPWQKKIWDDVCKGWTSATHLRTEKWIQGPDSKLQPEVDDLSLIPAPTWGRELDLEISPLSRTCRGKHCTPYVNKDINEFQPRKSIMPSFFSMLVS